MTDSPSPPFDVLFKTPRPGEKAGVPGWRVPFDTEWRLVEQPNVPEGALGAYCSVGWHVVRNAATYCPAFRVRQSINFRAQPSPSVVRAWEEATAKGLVVTDRRSGVAVELEASYSAFEAVVSWFVRGHEHQDAVLCCDRTEGVWYVEGMIEGLKVYVDADGREVAASEADGASGFHYRGDQHPHAIMCYGE